MMLSKSLFFSSFITVAYAQSCYWRDGGQPNPQYQPCSNDTSDPLSHICCNINVVNNEGGWDTCLPNGLCRASTGDNNFIYFRESCTLSDWEAGGCQELCTNTPNQRSGDVNVTPCDGTDSSEYWCCGNSTACCGDDASFGKEKVDRVFLGIISSSSMSSIASSTSTSIPLSSSSPSSTSTPSPATTPPNDDSGGLSTGAKAGIGVGAAFGVIALLALGALIGRRSYKKKKETAEATTYYEPVKAELSSSESRYEAPNKDVFLHEAPVPQKPVELPGVPIRPQELPGSGR